MQSQLQPFNGGGQSIDNMTDKIGGIKKGFGQGSPPESPDQAMALHNEAKQRREASMTPQAPGPGKPYKPQARPMYGSMSENKTNPFGSSQNPMQQFGSQFGGGSGGK